MQDSLTDPTPPPQTKPLTSVPPEDAFARDLISRWYECAPYGEQVPPELPKLLTRFCNKHGSLNEEGMSDAFHDAVDGDPILELFECIFATAATFTVTSMANAVFERDAETLKLIDIQPLGTLATPENDPNLECKHQHIMHPDQGGKMLFVATAEHLPPAPPAQPPPAGPTAGDSMDVHYAELKAENEALKRWREDHLRILDVSNAHFREARATVAHLWDEVDQPGIEGICKKLLETSQQLAAAETKAGAMEALNTVLRDALSICRETINLMAYGMSPHARQSCQATLATIERILALPPAPSNEKEGKPSGKSVFDPHA